MTTLTRITLGRLQTGGSGTVVPGVLEAAVEASLGAAIASVELLAQINSGLVISVAESTIETSVQSGLSIDLQPITIEVDIC